MRAPNSVVVLGLGYIGLPTAAAFATRGINVVGVDTDKNTVAAVNCASIPDVEPDLAIAVSGAIAQGRLRADTIVPKSDAYIIAVPTPVGRDRSPDLSYVRSAAASIAPALLAGNVVILESTVPLGTTRQLSMWLAEKRPDLGFPHQMDRRADINIAHCPERVLPGKIMIEIVTNDRVIGGVSPDCTQRAKVLYESFCQGLIVETDAESAEMTKLVENAYRDVNIAFANDLASICESMHLDVWEVIELANRHPRVNILRPGPGVGGHCIAVDPWFIISAAGEGQATLLRAARQVNDARPGEVVRKVIDKAQRIADPVIACLGLAFKANVDDLRESPAVQIVSRLSAALPTANICIVEPKTTLKPPELAACTNLQWMDTQRAIERADIVLLLADHAEFKYVKRSSLEGKIVYDTRGLWSRIWRA